MRDRRVFGLDVLRACAILIVVYAHGANLVGQSYMLGLVYKLSIPIDGVTLFFVLSGFLIGQILLKYTTAGHFDKSALMEFWIRRWFRTLPNYFMVLFWIVVLNYYTLDNQTILQFMVFSQNIAYPHPQIFPEAWSLAVEEWFYFSTPLVLFFLMKVKRKQSDPKKTIASWICLIILGSTLCRMYQTTLIPHFDLSSWDLNIRKEVITRLDSLMYGILGAFLKHYYEDKWILWANKSFILGLLLLLWAMPIIGTVVPETFSYNFVILTLAPISVIFLLPKLSSWNVSANPIKSTITFFSKISYSMYLIHLSLIQLNFLPAIFEWLPFRFEGYDDVAKYITYWALTISISAMFYRYYEYPMMNLRDKLRWIPEKSDGVITQNRSLDTA